MYELDRSWLIKNLRSIGLYKDKDGRLMLWGFFGDIELSERDLDRMCLICGALDDDCGTDCPGTSDELRALAREILFSDDF